MLYHLLRHDLPIRPIRDLNKISNYGILEKDSLQCDAQTKTVRSSCYSKSKSLPFSIMSNDLLLQLLRNVLNANYSSLRG